MNYTFHPAAEAEFIEAVRFYESRRSGLGADLLDEVRRIAQLIAKSLKA